MDHNNNNYLSIVGRSKDLIISGGYNVYPKEIEIILDDVDGVYESAIIGVPHPDFGEGVLAVVVLVAGADKNEDAIKNNLKQKIAAYKRPKNIFFVDELPRNTMGKVLKNILRDQHKNNLKQKIAAYNRPKSIFFVDELPRNTMCKVLKNILRDQHKDNFTTP